MIELIIKNDHFFCIFFFFVKRNSFRQPIKRKNFLEYNIFTQEESKVSLEQLKKMPNDEKVLIDVEKFRLREYLWNLVFPKKVIIIKYSIYLKNHVAFRK